MDDAAAPLGYETCRRCGEWFVEGELVASRVCKDCLRVSAENARIPYTVAGLTVGSPAAEPTRRSFISDSGHRRSARRLRQLVPELYELLMNEELVLAGHVPNYTFRANTKDTRCLYSAAGT